MNTTETMSPNVILEEDETSASPQEAMNMIKFMTATHKLELSKWKETCNKQAEVIRKLETTRKNELDFLAAELQKYEVNLAMRMALVTKQLAEKDDIIQKQVIIIEELNNKLEEIKAKTYNVPEIAVIGVDSNSDSGIVNDNDESSCNVEKEKTKPEIKQRKCRRFADSINFLRRVDFSPMKYKPSHRDGPSKASKKEEVTRKSSLDLPTAVCRRVDRFFSSDRTMSDDERSVSAEPIFSDSGIDTIVIRPKKMNDSMNNHFSDDGSEDTSEEVFDRVMTRSSVRRSVKANPKYKKINRTKSKLLEQIKGNIVN